MNKKSYNTIIADNPKVDARLLRESLRLVRALRKSGIKSHGPEVVSPFGDSPKLVIRERATGLKMSKILDKA